MFSFELETTATFTGHRPQKCGGYDEQNPTALWVKAKLAEEIDLAIREGCTTFISGGAIGTDIWAAEIVLNRGKSLVIARPFPSQHDRWPDHSQQRFFAVLELADHVEDVSPDPYQPWKMMVRNRWMVDRAGRLIAVYDGTAGGTSHCVDYGRQKQRLLRIIDPSSR